MQIIIRESHEQRVLISAYYLLTFGRELFLMRLQVVDSNGAPGKTRTCDLLIRSSLAALSQQLTQIVTRSD